MKLYEDKREVLLNLAKIYLNTKEKNRIFINDGIISANGFYSRKYLMFLALTYSKDEVKSLFSIDFDIDFDTMSDFVENEYKKIIGSSYDKVKKGKKILDDAETYYINRYTKFDELEIDESMLDIDDIFDFHI